MSKKSHTQKNTATPQPKRPDRKSIQNHLEVQDRVSLNDKHWFEQHPDKKYRFRPAVPAEFPAAIDPKPGSVIRVEKFSDRFRTRTSIGLTVDVMHCFDLESYDGEGFVALKPEFIT